MNGYTGKILRLDLTNKRVKTINTKDYEDWGGGHGMGSAIFWDLCGDKTIDGFDPKNVITIMTSPLSGTMAPSAGARCEVQGIGVQPYPIGWYTRSGFGGRFSPMLKAAGWDGIVIEGKAPNPVWVNIVNDSVTFEDASDLLGLDTWETQQEIWRRVGNGTHYNDWWQVGSGRDAGRTTQRPAVIAIGQAGENMSRMASLIHDAGSGAGQGGFGGILGSKNLKAISAIGTGSVEVADPKALWDARKWWIENHQYNADDPLRKSPERSMGGIGPGRGANRFETTRIVGCYACPGPCRRRSPTATYNESQCVESYWYRVGGTQTQAEQLKAVDILQRYGINAYEASNLRGYLLTLQARGILGSGKQIDSDPINMDQYGTLDWAEDLMKIISTREGIGDDLAEGLIRAAEKWGTLEEDLNSGTIGYPQWGYPWHWTLPGVEWAYGNLMGDRDINEHDFDDSLSIVHDTIPDLKKEVPAERFVELCSQKCIPYTGDPFMFDHNWEGSEAYETGIYSAHKAKMVAWHRHYTRFWKQSMLFCDWLFANFVNCQAADCVGFTPDCEIKFYNAVTGKNMTFADTMEIGRKIWNLDRAIWVLQGRHRDMEKFAGYVYTKGGSSRGFEYPVYNKTDNSWSYKHIGSRDGDTGEVTPPMILTEAGVEEWKTHFYELEGWDTSTGWPTRSTLEGLGLGNVADALAAAGKLGS